MSDMPKKVHIREVGPREGFQFEKAPISTPDKIRFVDSLSATGVKSIEFVSFVSPKWVPQMADAEAWVSGIEKKPGVEYIGIWLNVPGLERAIKQSDKLTIRPTFSLPASNTFSMKNTNKPVEAKLEEMPDYVNRYKSLGMDTLNIGVSVAFGCNYEGAVPGERVIELLKKQEAKAKDLGMKIGGITLMDTMGWANPAQIRQVVGEVRNRWPGHEVALHLHDTRGLAIANFMAGLEMGVAHYDAAVAGLGGCPFAAHKGAAGNICTEDTVFLCQEMGIETGIDLDRLIECAEEAERLVGHPLPGKVKVGGNLAKYRAQTRAAAAA
jgi:hydroxymethylglutaryl-CoA lyase